MSKENKHIDDGGPAFPTNNSSHPYCGISTRDYFAAKAMQALIQTLSQKFDTGPNSLISDESVSEFDKYVSVGAFEIADAMLAARKAVKP